jgi:hypothetical protein
LSANSTGYVGFMQDAGKLMVVAGLLLAIVGAVLWKFGGFGPLGRLPGDISVQKENFSFQFRSSPAFCSASCSRSSCGSSADERLA